MYLSKTTPILFIGVAFGFPFAIDHTLNIRQVGLTPKQISEAESNTGIQPSLTFDAVDQFVDVTSGSEHEFQAPRPGDLRGECPGLNAASNHGFLPRNGRATILQTISGLAEAYNMSPDLSGFLAAAAVVLSGDPLTQTWSIGGAFPASIPGLENPQGILGTHNKYEGDASVGRGDAYLNNGNPGVLRLESFDQLYNLAETFTLDTLRAHNNYVTQYSIQNNPHYFSAPFSGLVTPAAHEFVVNFMSNHSAEQPSGYLDRDILKTFFAISGPDDAHVHNEGMEQIPQNWYRRPTANQYSAPKNLADTALTALVYPDTVRFGGNTGTVNSFAGVDLSELTGGTYSDENLLQGNNLGCFVIQAMQAGLPDELKGFVADITPYTNLLATYANPILDELDCPELAAYNQGLFNVYPGFNDSASG